MKSTGILSAATLVSNVAGLQFVQYVSGSNNGDDTLVERADAILNPGSVSGHVHSIFGANNFSPSASYDSLQQSDCTTVGAADGSGNAQDKSSYWHPALYMEAKNGTGYIKVPTSTHKIYYRDFGSTKDTLISPFEFPKGFRMIAGNAMMRAPNAIAQYQNITQWICHTSSGPWGVGTGGGFPSDVTDCDAYPGFNGAIDFPHCWNGQDFDQENPFAHVSYAEGDPVHGDCPSTHPTRIPHIFMENEFNVHAIIDQVKPNSFVLAQGDPTGYGWHVDFFNGWDEGAIPELFKTCPAPYYGNEDIGTCPSYKKFDTKASACKLQTTYQENVDAPGQSLPGCNPVTTVNPAPMLAVAAVGIAESVCAAASGYGSGSSSASASSAISAASVAPSYSAAASSASPLSTSLSSSSSSSMSSSSSVKSSSSTSSSEAAESSSSASSTLKTTMTSMVSSTAAAQEVTTSSTTSSASAAAYTWGQHTYQADNHDNPDVVWVTEFITITERDIPTPVAGEHNAVKARRDHAQHLGMHRHHLHG